MPVTKTIDYIQYATSDNPILRPTEDPAIYALFDDHGLCGVRFLRRKRGPKSGSIKKAAEILEMLETGASVRLIASTLNVAPGTVLRVRKLMKTSEST